MQEKNSSKHHRSAFELLIQELSTDVKKILMIGAVPHKLDEEIFELLFPEQSQLASSTLKKFRFITFLEPNTVVYHVLARQFFLNLWQQQNRKQFCQLSRKLADEYLRRLKEHPVDAERYAEEWLYHLVACEPLRGLVKVANLFNEYIESQELGSAERLVRVIREQEAWLDGHERWIDFFDVFLDFSNYNEIDKVVLEQILEVAQDSLLGGCIQRLLGRLAVRQHQWEDGKKFYLQALDVFKRINSLENQALVHLDLGDVFTDVVESTGGILIDDRAFKNTIHAVFYILMRAPLLFYRFLAERINLLPNLYGMNYQNWISLRLLRLALFNYREASKYFREIHNSRGEVETQNRIASVLFLLSYDKSATKICEQSLRDDIVKTSPYYSAQVVYILGQVDYRRGRLGKAEKKLNNCLETFENYLDWEKAARSALILGKVFEKQMKSDDALMAYERALHAANKSNDVLIATEIHRRCKGIFQQANGDQFITQKASQMENSIKQLAYIDRYTGSVFKAFRNLSQRLAYPFTFLFIIAGIVGAGISMQFIEGELRIEELEPIVWSQSIDLIAGILLPLLMVWGYFFAYALIGQVIAWRLHFRDVDDAHRDLYLLNNDGISKIGKKNEIKLDWNKIHAFIVDNRTLYDKPMTFSSYAVINGDTDLVITAGTYYYKELINEIEGKLRIQRTIKLMIHKKLSLLRTPWLIFAVIFGFAIAFTLVGGVFTDPIYGCYQAIINDCPEKYRLYIQPLMQLGLFLSSIVFLIVSLIRWKLQSRRLTSDLVRNI